MQVVFIATAVMGLLYFLFAKRRFDFFSLAFISACVYFLPGFFSYVSDFTSDAANAPSGAGQIAALKTLGSGILPETYLVFVVVLAAVLLAAIVSDYVARDQRVEVTLRGGRGTAVWAVVLALAGFAVVVATSGSALFSPNKSNALQSFNSLSLVWEIGASLGAVLSFRQRRWGLLSVSMLLLFADLYVGIRASFAACVIAAFTLWLSDRGRQRLILQNWKIGLVGMLFAASMFIYKQLIAVVKLGRWDQVASLGTNSDTYVNSITKSEPFTTQAVLNEVLDKSFHVGTGHLLSSIGAAIPLFQSSLGRPATSFNTLFQPSLFPQATFGMANNIWAEMLSSGGWFLFALFVVFFVLLMAAGSYLLRVRDPVVTGGAALLFSYWAFYVHRNDLLFQLTLSKSIIFLWFVCVLLAMAGYEVRNRRKRTTTAPPAERPSDTLSG